MTTLEHLDFPEIEQIEQIRRSRVLILAASMLELEFLPELFELLKYEERSARIDVVLYGRGGEINAARRIALLLHAHCEQLSFIVPYHCQSACTALALSGKEILPGELALFSPIDPRLNAEDAENNDGPGALASEDVRLFYNMSKDWFGLDGQEIREQLLAALASSIFPTTLTSLYRSTLEIKQIATELLTFQLPGQSQCVHEIVEQLVNGYHSHSYALTAGELASLGLNIIENKPVARAAWDIALKLNALLGGGARKSPQDPRNDVLLASRKKIMVRKRTPGMIAPEWAKLGKS